MKDPYVKESQREAHSPEYTEARKLTPPKKKNVSMKGNIYQILIVETKPHYQMLLDFFLESSGLDYNVHFANNADEAELALLFSTPDLILLNVDIAEIGGKSAIEFIRNNDSSKRSPVIIMLDKSDREKVREVANYPFVDFVVRPIEKYIFIARMRTALLLHDTITQSLKQDTQIQAQINKLNLLQTVVTQSANSIAVFNATHELQWANNGFLKIYGFSQDEYQEQKGKRIEVLSKTVDIKKQLDRLYSTAGPVEYLSHIRIGTLEYKWVQTTLSPILDNNGTIINLVAIGSDVTAQKQAEDELVIQRDDVIAMTEDLKTVIRETQSKNEEIRLRNIEIKREKELIEAGKKRTEKLLMSVLPFEAAIQLKSKGEARPRNYKMVSVLFTDFKGFTKACMHLTPQEVVNTVHAYFAVFEDIADNRNIEKIKTIGDAFMAAGGIPLRNKSNPIDVVLAGLEIQHFMQYLDQVPEFADVPRWELRLGVHTGAVIAGVVGKRKIAYDIWGDTVNVASRMETAGEPRKVNISGDTYEYIKDYFDCTYRGQVEVKNHGAIDMYFVDRLKKEYALDQYGVKPNETFQRFLFSL